MLPLVWRFAVNGSSRRAIYEDDPQHCFSTQFGRHKHTPYFEIRLLNNRVEGRRLSPHPSPSTPPSQIRCYFFPISGDHQRSVGCDQAERVACAAEYVSPRHGWLAHWRLA